MIITDIQDNGGKIKKMEEDLTFTQMAKDIKVDG
jgi:hypothetical protein